MPAKDREFPTVNRVCPKCPGTQANGPEYRRGVGTDDGLGEHLRYYCTVCRFMSFEPTKDTDTPARRKELAAAFATRKPRPLPAMSEGDARRLAGLPRDEDHAREQDIERVRRSEQTRRPSWGWRR